MQLKVKILGIDSGGKPFVFLNGKDADELNITASERITVQTKKKITAIVNISNTSVKRGFLGVTEEVRNSLSLKPNSKVTVEIAPFPKSLQFIRNKLSGKKLLYPEIYEIVQDLVDGNLSENSLVPNMLVHAFKKIKYKGGWTGKGSEIRSVKLLELVS